MGILYSENVEHKNRALRSFQYLLQNTLHFQFLTLYVKENTNGSSTPDIITQIESQTKIFSVVIVGKQKCNL